MPVRFPVRAHTWVAGQIPRWGCVRGNWLIYFPHIHVSLPLSLSSPPSKNKEINIFNKKKKEALLTPWPERCLNPSWSGPYGWHILKYGIQWQSDGRTLWFTVWLSCLCWHFFWNRWGVQTLSDNALHSTHIALFSCEYKMKYWSLSIAMQVSYVNSL